MSDGKLLALGSQLQGTVLSQLKEVLKKYQHAFAWSYKDLKGVKPEIYQHYIDLELGTRPCQRQRRTNPIYAEMVKCGCPKSQDDAPKTMSELQTYWHLLESDKRIVLVFYNDPSGAKRQGFSDIFLNDLSKFNGAICVVTEQLLNKSLQCFSESQPMLVEDILGWIKAIVLEA